MGNYPLEGWLVGWRHIAEYLDVSVRTAKRWYYHAGMPVFHAPGGGKAAIPEVLDSWLIKANKRKGG